MSRMTIKQTIIFIVVVTIAVFISMQIVHGQRVDKLINDTKKEMTYREELVNKMYTSGCANYKSNQFGKNESSIFYPVINSSSVKVLEETIKECVREGKIK
jgi:hypothetical protein